MAVSGRRLFIRTAGTVLHRRKLKRGPPTGTMSNHPSMLRVASGFLGSCPSAFSAETSPSRIWRAAGGLRTGTGQSRDQGTGPVDRWSVRSTARRPRFLLAQFPYPEPLAEARLPLRGGRRGRIGIRATLHARPFEMPRRLTACGSTSKPPRLGDRAAARSLPDVRGAVRLSCVAEGVAWGPPEIRFPIRDYRWRASTYANTWLALFPTTSITTIGRGFRSHPGPARSRRQRGWSGHAFSAPQGDVVEWLGDPESSGLEFGYSHMNIETVCPTSPTGARVGRRPARRTGMTWSGRKSQQNDPHCIGGLDRRQASRLLPVHGEAYLRDYATLCWP